MELLTATEKTFWRNLMRTSKLFFLLQLVIVMVLASALYANAIEYGVDYGVDANGELIPEDVCDLCQGKVAGDDFRIFYNDCEECTENDPDQCDPDYLYAFDRDCAIDWNAAATVNGDLITSAKYYDVDADTTYYTGAHHLRFYATNATCEPDTNPCGYLFAICNCEYKRNFNVEDAYAWEIEIITPGVYWTDRNLTLMDDADEFLLPLAGSRDGFDNPGGVLNSGTAAGDFDYPRIGDETNQVRVISATSKGLICDGNGTALDGTDIDDIFDFINWGVDVAGWNANAFVENGLTDHKAKQLFANGSPSDAEVAIITYDPVVRYLNRSYGSTIEGSTCTANWKVFNDVSMNPATLGQYDCNDDVSNAKVLLTGPSNPFGSVNSDFNSDNAYLLLDIPTMVYDPDEVANCTKVEIYISIVEPFAGVCTNCCNTPLCTCLTEVGTFGCAECSGPVAGETCSMCLPYVTEIGDRWWDAIGIANMGSEAMDVTLKVYMGGSEYTIDRGSVPAKSVDAFMMDTAVAGEGLPSGARGYVEIEGTQAFDAYYMTFDGENQYGAASYLGRKGACSGNCE